MQTENPQDLNWQKGDFYAFRATREITMPADIDLEKLRKNEIFQYDGTTMRTDDGSEFKIPQLKGTYLKAWIVPADDTTTTYQPQPAGVEIHDAQQSGNDKLAGRRMATSHEDEQQVGTVSDREAMRRQAGVPKLAKPLAEMSPLARKMAREFDLLVSEWDTVQPREEEFTAAEPDPKPALAPTREQTVGPAQDPNWVKGDFYEFRATRDIVMPADIDLEKLHKDEIFQYDGTTLRTEDGSEFRIPQLKGTYIKEWIVPADDTTTTYQPRPSGVEIHDAQQAGNDKPSGRRMVTSHEDEQHVGTVSDREAMRRQADRQAEEGPIRNAGAVVVDVDKHFAGADQLSSEVQVGSGPKRLQVTAAQTEPGTAKAGKRSMEVVEDQEGVPIATLGTAKKESFDITDASATRREISQLDNTAVSKKTKFTVTEHNPEDEGEVVASVSEDEGAVIEAEVVEPAEETAPEGVPMTPELQAKISSIRMFVTDFAWDLNRHWKSRVKEAVEKYSEKPDWLKGILAVETSDVQRHIRAKLKKAGIEV